MVEISLSGSGEGLGWVTNRGYSTARFWANAQVVAESEKGQYVNLRLFSADSRTRAAENSSSPAGLGAFGGGRIPGLCSPTSVGGRIGE